MRFVAGSACGDVSGKCRNWNENMCEQSARSLQDFAQLSGTSGGWRDRGGECCLR